MPSSIDPAGAAQSADVALLEKIEELSLIRALNDRLAQAATYNTACQMLVDLVREERAADAGEYVSIDAARCIARLEATAPEDITAPGAFDVDLAHGSIVALLERPEPRLLAVVPRLPWHAERRASAASGVGANAPGVVISAPTR